MHLSNSWQTAKLHACNFRANPKRNDAKHQLFMVILTIDQQYKKVLKTAWLSGF